MLGERRQAQDRVGWGTGWGAGSPALAGPSVWGRLGLAELAAAPAQSGLPATVTGATRPPASSASLAALAGGEAPLPAAAWVAQGSGN